MSFINATKPDRKSGGSRGTCCAPFPHATAQGYVFRRSVPRFLSGETNDRPALPLAKSIPNMRFRQNISRVGRIVFDLLA
jgi:hypothetical protein